MHAETAGEEAAFGHRLRISNIFGTYLGNRASKDRENLVAGAAGEWKCERGLRRRLWLLGSHKMCCAGAVQRLIKFALRVYNLQHVHIPIPIPSTL
jgi:hypothetical protein